MCPSWNVRGARALHRKASMALAPSTVQCATALETVRRQRLSRAAATGPGIGTVGPLGQRDTGRACGPRAIRGVSPVRAHSRLRKRGRPVWRPSPSRIRSARTRHPTGAAVRHTHSTTHRTWRHHSVGRRESSPGTRRHRSQNLNLRRLRRFAGTLAANARTYRNTRSKIIPASSADKEKAAARADEVVPVGEAAELAADHRQIAPLPR